MSRFIPSSFIQPKAQKQYSKKAKTACAIKQKAFILFCSTKSTEQRLAYKKASKVCKKIIVSEKIKSNAAKAEKLSNCPTGGRTSILANGKICQK